MTKIGKLVGYGLGDYGLNIYWNMISFYLLYWYTAIIGVEPQIAGFIYMLGMFWDAISDPIMAAISERFDSRHGSYRPFILYGSGVLAICFILLFWIPPFEGLSLIAALIIINLLFRTAYTIVAIPYSMLSSRLTYNSVERSEYSGVRMFFAFAGLLSVSMFLPPLLDTFTDMTGSSRLAFKWVATTGGVIATLALLSCFCLTKEQPLPKLTRQSKKIWRGIMTNIRANRALRLLLFMIIFNTGATTALNVSMVFLIDANQPEFASKSIVLTAYAIAIMSFVPVWTVLIRKFSRKIIWITSASLTTLTGLHMLTFGPWLIMAIPIQIVIFGICVGAFSVLIWAFIPDCVEYGESTSGYRSEAAVFGSALITQKVSGGVMGFIIGIMLQRIGFGNYDGPQNKDVGESLIVFISIFPALFLCLTIIPVLFMPLQRKAHADIVDKLSGIDRAVD